MPSVPTVDKSLLKQYGLPTALLFSILGPLFGAYVWLVQAQLKTANEDRIRIEEKLGKQIKDLGDDVDFLSRMVDLSCVPVKSPRPSPSP